MTIDDSVGDLVLVRDLRTRSDTRQQHARAARAGVEVRVGRGAYVPSDRWDALDRRSQHVVRMLAFARTRRQPPTFSHWSAAAWHGLPIVGARSGNLHLVVGRTTGGRSASGVVAHSLEVPSEDVIAAEGIRVTSLSRTAVDLAATAPTPAAVAIVDHVLRTDGTRHRGSPGAATARDELYAAWGRALPFRGHRRAREVIDFADGLAGSPLESVSRANMHAIGCPQPELQVPFSDGDGLIGIVDFSWPAFGVVGEADGDLKYLDREFRSGRSAEQVVLDEKIREDRLRALGLRVIRWRWETAVDARALGSRLAAAALPVDARIPWSICGSSA